MVPNISGNNGYTQLYLAQQDLNGTYFNFNERTAYVGVGVLALCVIGLAYRRSMYRQFGRVFVVLAALAAAVAYGFPPAYRLAVHFPLFHSVNYNRVILIVAFGLVGLGAIGFDALLRRARAVQPRRNRWFSHPNC